MEAFQTAAAPKLPDIFDRIAELSPSLADSDKVLHRSHPLVLSTEVTLANGFPYEFRDGGLRASRTGMQRIPEMIVKVQLRSPHDVYYTSPFAVTKVKNKYLFWIFLLNQPLAGVTPFSGRLALKNHVLLSQS